MKTIFQNIFLLVALLIVPVSSTYSEEINNSNIETDFDFNKVSTKESTTQINTRQLALIENNLQYVKISSGLYAFTLIIITILIWIKREDCQAKDMITIIGLASVIFGTLLLVLIVDTTETLTAPIGIFGAIAGYLFGAAQKKQSSKE